jgi:DNA repair exonuclease SbcCD ATPase subunit
MKTKKINLIQLLEIQNKISDLGIEVKTDNGFFNILSVDKTDTNNFVTIKTNKGNTLKVSENHLFKNSSFNWDILDNILNNDKTIQTINGYENIIETRKSDNKIDLYDIQVEGVGKYLSNNIILHNSNILNSITYGLYGTTFDTLKKEKNKDNKFINNKNTKDYTEVEIKIEINGEDFLIKRRSERKWNKTHTEITGVSTKTKLFKLNNSGFEIDIENLSEQDKNKTQKLIYNSIGDFDEFITKSLINADTLNDVLTTDHAQFLDRILRDTGLDVFEKKITVFKEYIKDKYKKETLLKISEEDYKEKINNLNQYILEANKDVLIKNNSLIILQDRIKNGEEHIEKLYHSKLPIDPEIENLNIENIKNEILSFFNEKNNLSNLSLSLVKDIELLKSFSYDEKEYQNYIIEIENYNTIIQNNHNDLKLVNAKITELMQNIAENNGKIFKYKNDINNLNNKIEILKKEIEFNIKNLENKILTLTESKNCPTCKRVKDENSIIEIEKEINNLNNQISLLRIQLNDNTYITNEINDNLTRLNQLIVTENNNILKINKNIEDEKNKILEIEKNNNIYLLKISEIKQKIAEIDIIQEQIQKRQKIENEYNNIPNLIQIIDLKITTNNNLLEKYDNTQLVIKENEKINNKILVYKTKINEFKDNEKNLIKEIQNISKNIEKYNFDIKTLSETLNTYLKQLIEENIQNEYLNCIHRDGIPSVLLKKLIPKVNEYLEGYLEDVNFNVFFDDDLNFLMYHKDTKHIVQSVLSGSGMERVFACICLRLALRFMNNRSRPNLLLLDELFGKLSEKNANNFIGLMNKVKQDIDKILIIEHAYGDIINPDYLIKVEKNEDDCSTISLEY